MVDSGKKQPTHGQEGVINLLQGPSREVAYALAGPIFSKVMQPIVQSPFATEIIDGDPYLRSRIEEIQSEPIPRVLNPRVFDLPEIVAHGPYITASLYEMIGFFKPTSNPSESTTSPDLLKSTADFIYEAVTSDVEYGHWRPVTKTEATFRRYLGKTRPNGSNTAQTAHNIAYSSRIINGAGQYGSFVTDVFIYNYDLTARAIELYERGFGDQLKKLEREKKKTDGQLRDLKASSDALDRKRRMNGSVVEAATELARRPYPATKVKAAAMVLNTFHDSSRLEMARDYTGLNAQVLYVVSQTEENFGRLNMGFLNDYRTIALTAINNTCATAETFAAAIAQAFREVVAAHHQSSIGLKEYSDQAVKNVLTTVEEVKKKYREPYVPSDKE
jgi:hypothetical protein